MTTSDVAIVGAGPTGTILAILLAQRGHSVTLLDKQRAPYPLPRAVHFDHEIGRVLQACGIGNRLRGIIEPAEIYEWRNGDGLPLVRFGRRGDGLSGWPQASMFNQPELERLLADRVTELPTIDVQRGREVVAFDVDAAGVAITHRRSGAEADASDGADDDTMHTRYMVGCDGANSLVRTLLDVDVEDLGFFFDWLVVDLILHDDRVYDPVNQQVCDPLRPTTLVSGGPGRRRWEFMRLPEEDPAELSGVESAWRLLAPWDVHPGNATLERHANYTFRARWAERWREGPVFLAGDAAHQMPPFAGQGMCSGARDAANLAWKVDLVLRGLAADSALDSYQAERMPNVRAVIDFSIELGKIICMPDPVEAAARDEFMSALVVEGDVSEVPPLPGITSGIVDADSPQAGLLLLQGIVDDGRGPMLFDDVVGAGFRLVTSAAVPVSTDVGEWFATIGGAVVTLDEHSPIRDPERHYADWLARHDSIAVLQRPDFAIFGTASNVAEVEALLCNLRDALGARTSHTA